MNKVHKNKKGFSSVERIVIVLAIVVIGVVGYLVYKNHESKNSKLNSAVVIKNASSSNWHLQQFKNDQYNFSDYFPCNPGVAKITSSDSNGRNTSYGFVCKFADTGIVYEVLATIYNTNINVPLPPLALSKAQNVQDGQIVSSSKLQIDGNPAETFQYTAKVESLKAFGSVEYVVKKNVLYTAITTSLNNPNQKAQYFINGFKVGN